MRTRFPVLQNRLVDRAQPDGNLQPGAWREGRKLEDTIVVQGPNTASRDGRGSETYSSIGATPQQDQWTDRREWWLSTEHCAEH
ncbi:hypothetical protein MAR_013159 [Mya arenaria]|uniref:Uncharacterized protein n=1 Tax=Mya arenaria TaxID=6604 RepID=A0ABY7FZ73_MYAAR|nr:hypothetical protein MAR_013159 [Mya arenaria]